MLYCLTYSSAKVAVKFCPSRSEMCAVAHGQGWWLAGNTLQRSIVSFTYVCHPCLARLLFHAIKMKIILQNSPDRELFQVSDLKFIGFPSMKFVILHLTIVTVHECHRVANHPQLDCLFNRFFRLATEKHQISTSLALFKVNLLVISHKASKGKAFLQHWAGICHWWLFPITITS